MTFGSHQQNFLISYYFEIFGSLLTSRRRNEIFTKGRKAERPKSRKAERPKGRKTERPKDRKTEASAGEY
jgi:hypothetical protein